LHSARPYISTETDLHDLRGQDPKMRGREIGVEMHRGEQGFSPDRHSTHRRSESPSRA
jgi:hypothetical protein